MNALALLKEITENQKSISTKRLAPILKEIESMYIKKGEKVRKQRNELSILQMERNRKKQLMENNQRRKLKNVR
jgi:molybdopterin converting factor small subunit